MQKLLPILVALIFIVSCKSNTSSSHSSDDTPQGIFKKYPSLNLPFSVADSSLASVADTATLRYAAFANLVPDTILKPLFGSQKKLSIQPVGLVHNGSDEIFAVTLIKGNRMSALYAMVFIKDTFVAAIPLLVDKNDQTFNTVSIDSKLVIEKNKVWSATGGPFYERQVLAYNGQGIFTTVLNETNVNRIVNADIYNPLDSMPRTFPHSGNYKKDKNNFVSISDGSKPGVYKFFVHFETRGKEPCGGEIKGEFILKNNNEGVYIENGTTCVMNFIFAGNKVLVKEQGSCGNHRGIKCFFNDTYTKEKPVKPTRKK
jgi:hypothetical protein